MWAEQIKSYNGNTVIRMFQVFENASTIMKLRLGALSVCTIIIIVLYCQAGQKISNQVKVELYRVIHEKVTSDFFFLPHQQYQRHKLLTQIIIVIIISFKLEIKVSWDVGCCC
jgi:hypothetical protein